MRRYTARLLKVIETGRNKLGTPVCEEVEAGCCVVRKAPASADLVRTEGNDAHVVTRTFATKRPARDFMGVTSFEVQGLTYRLVDVSQTEIETLITGRLSKLEAFDGNQDNADG